MELFFAFLCAIKAIRNICDTFSCAFQMQFSNWKDILLLSREKTEFHSQEPALQIDRNADVFFVLVLCRNECMCVRL